MPSSPTSLVEVNQAILAWSQNTDKFIRDITFQEYPENDEVLEVDPDICESDEVIEVDPDICENDEVVEVDPDICENDEVLEVDPDICILSEGNSAAPLLQVKYH
jgi:hypothetical protein